MSAVRKLPHLPREQFSGMCCAAWILLLLLMHCNQCLSWSMFDMVAVAHPASGQAWSYGTSDHV
jgi:hypothetical protein